MWKSVCIQGKNQPKELVTFDSYSLELPVSRLCSSAFSVLLLQDSSVWMSYYKIESGNCYREQAWASGWEKWKVLLLAGSHGFVFSFRVTPYLFAQILIVPSSLFVVSREEAQWLGGVICVDWWCVTIHTSSYTPCWVLYEKDTTVACWHSRGRCFSFFRAGSL